MTTEEDAGKKLRPLTGQVNNLKILLYGDVGSGKTTLAATAQDSPEMRNVVIMNIEGGLISIAHRTDIKQIPIKSVDEIEVEFWALRNKADKYKDVRTVVIDSGTELQTLNLEQISMEAVAAQRKSRSGRERIADDLWQEDYGRSTSTLKRVFRWYKDLPYHVVITALAKHVYPKVSSNVNLEDVDPIAVMPTFTAKLGAAVMGYVDMVWYCYYDTDDNKFKMLTRPHGPYRAKTRGRFFAERIGPIVVEPHLGELFELLKQSVQDNVRGASVPVNNKPVRKRSANK